MRTIKASEVRKGMRVRFGSSNGDANITTEGVVTEVSGEYAVSASFGSYCIGLNPDHPVTVLAEPEPEWVEGAWYWAKVGRTLPQLIQRNAAGWTYFQGDPNCRFSDEPTILGRVLIVDWPGDLAAQSLLVRGATKSPCDSGLPDDVAEAVDNVADAIRTQGGAS